MTNAFFQIIMKFGQEVDMEDVFNQNIEILIGAILVWAVLSCFFGFKLFRVCSAVMTFFLTAIGICEILRDTVHMGIIVTTFAIIGLFTAFLAYHWYKFSVFFICALLGYSIAAIFSGNIWISLGAAVVLGVISIPFSAVVTIFASAIWGAMTLGSEGLRYIGVDDILIYKIITVAVFTAAGLFIQYMMNRSQNLIPVKQRKIKKQRKIGKHEKKLLDSWSELE